MSIRRFEDSNKRLEHHFISLVLLCIRHLDGVNCWHWADSLQQTHTAS